MRQITIDEARTLVMAAFAEPHRLRVLSYLLERGEATVGEIVDFLGLDQPHTSHHLSCLRNCGLVTAERTGRFVRYRLNGKRRVARILQLVDEHADDHLEEILGCRIVGGHHGH